MEEEKNKSAEAKEKGTEEFQKGNNQGCRTLAIS